MKEPICTHKQNGLCATCYLQRNYGAADMRARAARKVCGMDHCDLNGHGCTKDIQAAIEALPLEGSR